MTGSQRVDLTTDAGKAELERFWAETLDHAGLPEELEAEEGHEDDLYLTEAEEEGLIK